MSKVYVLDECLRAHFLPPHQRPLLVVGHVSLVGRVQVVGPAGGDGRGPVRMRKLQRALAIVPAAVLRAVDDEVGGSAVAEMAVAVGVLKLDDLRCG